MKKKYEHLETEPQVAADTAVVYSPKQLVLNTGTVKRSGIDKGLDDIKNGNVFHAKDAADIVKQIFG